MFFEVKKSSNKQFKSPLKKVPFATFYPLQKYLRGTCFFQKRLFQVDSTMVKKIDLSRDKIDFGTEKIVGLFLNLNS